MKIVVRSAVRSVVAILCLGALAACATDDGYVYGEESISIPYDPYDYDPADLLEEANNHCQAYGMTAVPDGETVDQGSVRWRYRHFQCV